MNKNQITITRRDDDRSYTTQLITIIKEDNTHIYFNHKMFGCITLNKKKIKTREDASNFKTLETIEDINYHKVKIGKNKRTNDISFTDCPQKLIAENKTHIQIAVQFPWGIELIVLAKEEHDIEILYYLDTTI